MDKINRSIKRARIVCVIISIIIILVGFAGIFYQANFLGLGYSEERSSALDVFFKIVIDSVGYFYCFVVILIVLALVGFVWLIFLIIYISQKEKLKKIEKGPNNL